MHQDEARDTAGAGAEARATVGSQAHPEDTAHGAATSAVPR
jgi:hypothetical protein